MTKLPKLNPCEQAWYARAMAWAETDCWCCSATRGALAGIGVGLWLDALLNFKAAFVLGALCLIVVAAAIVFGALGEKPADATEETPKE